MLASYLLKVWVAEGPAGSSGRLWLSARLLHTEASEGAVDMRKSLTHTLTRMLQPPTTICRTCTMATGEGGMGGWVLGMEMGCNKD